MPIKIVSKEHQQFIAEFQKLLDSADKRGFERGWREAMAAVAEVLQKSEALMKGPTLATPSAAPPKSRGRPPRAKGLVLKAITDDPGIRGSGIVKKLAADGTPISERTVRTSLRRLRKGREIHQRAGGGWFPGESSESADDEPSARIRRRLPNGESENAAA
jgi:hypothetical protein